MIGGPRLHHRFIRQEPSGSRKSSYEADFRDFFLQPRPAGERGHLCTWTEKGKRGKTGQTMGMAAQSGVFVVPFAIGEVITNKTLYTTFKCACEGGVRYSSAHHLLVLVSNFVDPRHTGGKWDGNILYYTGSGKTGNQDMTRGMNKRLFASLRSSVPIYYFEVYTQGSYTYRGRIVAAGEPFQRQEPGADGVERKVWIFPLRLENP